MTTLRLGEHTVTVAGKPMFVAEAGDGPLVVMLHGGGPGAPRRLQLFAQHRRARTAFPGARARHARLRSFGQGWEKQDQSDPFGYLADMIRGLLDELGIHTASLVGNSYGGAAALRLALDTPERVDKLVLMGPGGIGTHTRSPHRRAQQLVVLLRRRRT